MLARLAWQIAACWVLTCITVRAQTSTFTLPSGLENTPGTAFADPFFDTEPPWVTQSYSAASFNGTSSDAIPITALAFRIDENEKGSLDATIPDLRLTMAVTRDPIRPGSSLPNSMVVFDSQNVHLTGQNPAASPAFDIDLSLMQPFIYDRRAGDLVLRFESHQPGGQGLGIDAQFNGEGVLYYFEPLGIFKEQSEVIVTQFSYASVPEPAPILLWAITLVAGVLASGARPTILRTRFLVLMLLALEWPFDAFAGAQDGTIVVPNSAASTPGSLSFDPFFFTQPPAVTQVYDSTFFAKGGVMTPIRLDSISFRLDETTKGSLDVVVPQITLTLSTSPGLLSDYDPSRTIQRTLVYQENNVHLSAALPNSLSQFGITFLLTTPYVYDPDLGPLVLDIQSHATFGNLTDVDAQSSALGTLFYYEPGGQLGQRVSRAEVLVTKFGYTAVPEPSSYVLWTIAVLTILAFRRMI